MKNTTASLLLFLLSLPTILAGCGSDAAPPADSGGQAVPDKATVIEVTQVTARDIDAYFTLPGSLEAWEDLTLAAEISGPIDWVGPEEGARLGKGQRILTIDSVSQRANLESARVDADIKRATMERYARLVSENLVSRQEYDNSVNAYETARQNLELARIAMQKSVVTSPVAGVLDRRLVERGEYIKSGDPVALVVQVNRLKALADVPEKDVRDLHVGEEVDVIQARIDNGEDIRRRGTLIHLAFKADPVTRTYRAKIAVDNSDGQLRPGMIVRIEALRQRLRDVITIPLYAVVDLDGRKVVFVEVDGKAQLRPVRIDRVIGDQAVIAAGLQPKDRLVVKGQQLLADGAPVLVKGR